MPVLSRLQHAALIIALLCGACVDRAPGANSHRIAQPAPEVEVVDLTSAQAETTLSPIKTIALPEGEFPDFVVVDWPNRKAYAATEFVAINVLSLISTVWVEAVAVLVAASLLWWLRRVAGRPQLKGTVYCRRCNYELTNLSGEVCPECGSPVGGRGSVVGRPRWPRVTIGILLLGLAVSVYAGTFQQAPRLVWPGHWPAWWSRSLDDVAEANSKYKWLITHSRVLSRITELDLSGAGGTRALWTGSRAEVDHINGMFLSSDATRLVVWHAGSVRSWDLPNRTRLSQLDDRDNVLSFRTATTELVEVSRDGRVALIVGPAPHYVAQAVDLDAERELWRIDGLFGRDLTNLRILHGDSLDRFIVAGDGASSGRTELTEWFIDEQHRTNRMRRVLTDAFALGPRLARDGLGPLVWASNLEQVEAWNLQTERVERRIALPARSILVTAWSADLPRLIITMLDEQSRTWVVDTDAGRVLAEIAEAPPRTRGTDILDDGRTLAVWGYDEDQSRRVLHLYDLTALKVHDSTDGG